MRLALAGAIGLAALEGTYWLRAHGYVRGPVSALILGAMPNLAAGHAMPLVLSYMFRRAWATASGAAAERAFRRLVLFTTVGLVAWEFLQQGSRTLRFDPRDIAATLLGALSALGTHRLLARDGGPPRLDVGPSCRGEGDHAA